jgi:HEAT repeat protein
MRFAMRFRTPVVTAALLVLTGATARAQDKDKELELKRSNIPAEGKTLYEWGKELQQSKDPSVREKAIAMLKFYGSAARPYLNDIVRAMDDKDVGVRVNAIIALGFIGLDAEHRQTAISGLIRSLGESQGIVRFQAARALGRLGSDAAPALSALIAASKSLTTWEIRAAAVNALGTAGWDQTTGQNRDALRALLYALSDACLEVRFEAIRSLILLGKPRLLSDQKEEEALLQKLTSVKQPKKVSIWARVCLLRLADKVSGDKVSEKYLSEIAHHLKSDGDYQARLQAAHALATVGREARSRIPDLIDALDDKEPTVLVYVCIALGEMGDVADKAVPFLKRLTEHENEAVKQAAKEAIKKITEKVKVEEKLPPMKNARP